MKMLRPLYLITVIISFLIIILGKLNIIDIVVSEDYSKTLLVYTFSITIFLELLFLVLVLLRLSGKNQLNKPKSSLVRLSILELGVSIGLLLLASVNSLLVPQKVSIYIFILVLFFVILKIIFPINRFVGTKYKTLRIVISLLVALTIVPFTLNRNDFSEKIIEISEPESSIYFNEQFCWRFEIPEDYTFDSTFNSAKYQKARFALGDVLLDNPILFTLDGESVLAISYTSQLNDTITDRKTFGLSQMRLYIEVYENTLSLRIYKEGEILLGDQEFSMIEFIPRDELPFRLMLLTSVYKDKGINILIIYMDEYKGVELIKALMQSQFGCDPID